MSFIWSTENIRALAPDGLTFDQARGIFFANKWLSLYGNEHYVWGVYPAGPSWRFETAVKLAEPSFHCSCRSRTKPCKHNLALLLTLQRSSDSFLITNDLPDWVEEWQSRQHPAPKVSLTAEEQLIRDQRREAGRDQRLSQMKSGIQDLERWLHNVLETGLAEVREFPPSFWDDFAARMVDAKLGGIARNIRLVKEYLQNEDWPDRLLADLADFFLLTRAFRNIDELPTLIQRDLLNVAGFSIKKTDVLQTQGTLDDWLIMGQYTAVEEKLTFRHTWLKGIDTEKEALLLDFAWGNQGFEYHWNTGQLIEGELCYYPSSFPQRALFRSWRVINKSITRPTGYPGFEPFAGAYAKAIAENPWLSGFPALLEDIRPVMHEDLFLLVDTDHKQLLINEELQEKTMKLLALSCGSPITIFGEWNGYQFRPLSAFSEDKLVDL